MLLHDLFSHGVVMFAFEGWGAAIAIAAVAVSAGVSAYSASEQAGAVGDAADANSYNSLQERALKDKLYHESRGSTGFANMAEYARDASGNPIEPQLYKDAQGIYDYWKGTPAEQAKRYNDINARYAASQGQAEQTAAGIFNGDLERQALEANAPVEQARLDVATARKQSGTETLAKMINGMKATQQKRGFTGDSYGNRKLEADVSREINTDSATFYANAGLANASEQAEIRKKGIGLRLANISLPYNMAQESAAMSDLPQNLALQQSAKLNAVYNPFRIGVGAGPQVNSMPLVTPIASTGQIAGQAGASVASGVGNLAAAKYIADSNAANNASLFQNNSLEYGNVGYLTAPTGGSQYNSVVGSP